MTNTKKKKAKIAPTDSWDIHVERHEWTWDTTNRDTSEPYTRNDTSTTRELIGIRNVGGHPPFGYFGHDLTISFKPEPGKTYYLLYTEYSGGDSFGNDDNRYVEFHELYQTYDKAEAALKILEDDSTWEKKAARKKKSKRGEITITLENGEKMNIYRIWEGYFESLDGHNIVALTYTP